jgi:diketogulonate reductase-like aldo/keto reductase
MIYKKARRRMFEMEYATINTGAKIPLEGFGAMTMTAEDAGKTEETVYNAIKIGYRLIDTAAAYMNEEQVGRAIKRAIDEGIVKREELFVVSKLWIQDMKNYDDAAKAIDASLKKLGLDYLDLYLEHQAMGDYFAAWQAMEDAYKAGKLKAIGVANFFPNILVNFCETVEIKPAVNQVELHPFFTQEDALGTMKEYGVVPMAWAPLAEGKHGIFTDAEMSAIGEKYGKTAAQVALRWNTQRGVSIIPKSSHTERMEQNLNIWDFSLTDEEMEIIGKKDIGHSEIINHFDSAVVKMVLGMKIHG